MLSKGSQATSQAVKVGNEGSAEMIITAMYHFSLKKGGCSWVCTVLCNHPYLGYGDCKLGGWVL